MAKTPARIADHPLHPMLVAFPIGLFVFSFVCDLIFRYGGAPVWHDMAFYTMLGGIIGALLAALPGFVDYLSLVRGSRGTREDRQLTTIATMHMVLNLTIVVVYAVNAYLRTRTTPDAPLPFWLSLAAIVLLCVSGWLGGSLVYVHRVAVAEPTDATMPHPTFIEKPVEQPRTTEPSSPQRAVR
jgi:uncharacterized membrane protein